MKPSGLLSTVLLLISMLSVIAVLPASSAQQITSLNIDPIDTQLPASKIGTTITVNFDVSNVKNLFAWDLNLSWNPAVLNLTQIQEGPFLRNIGTTFFTWTPTFAMDNRSQGFVRGVDDVLLESGSASGSGVLATLSFKVLNTGTSQISITGSSMTNPTANAVHYITSTITNGVVTVGGSNIVTPTPNSAASHSPTSQTTGNPNQSPTSTPATPEFPTFVLVLLMLVIATSVLGILKKTKNNQVKF